MPKGIPSATRSQQVQEVLENLNLAKIQGSRIRSLSPEERRRVSIGIELLSSPSPSLLILDDPFEDLDPGAEARLVAMLHDLSNLGKSFLLLNSHSSEGMMLAR
jgi:ABC-type multidrug transport system ATPase subunit